MRQHGFSLIELLMVVAIIAVLAALLMPVLQSAKTAAKDTKSLAQLSQIGRCIHIYSSDYDDHFPFVSNYFDTTSVRLGLAPANAFGRWSSISTIKEVLQPYRVENSLWVSSSDPGELPDPNPLPIQHRMSFQYLISNPCSGSLSELAQPSASSFIRERGPFRRGKAYSYRVDGSTKLLSWSESGEEAERFRETYLCHEQSLRYW